MISVFVCLLPVFVYGEHKPADMGKDTFKPESQNLDRAQQELMKGCEGIEGIDLALCIVDRYALDLQTKQNERLDRLRNMAASRKDENDFPKHDEPIEGDEKSPRKGEDPFERQKQLRKQQFRVNFSNAYRTRRRRNHDNTLLEQ